MEALNKLEQIVPHILSAVKPPVPTYGDIDTCSIIYELASRSTWGRDEFKKLDFISKRLDISKKFFLGYRAGGRKAVDIELTNQSWLELAVAVLFKATIVTRDELVQLTKLKRFNVLFKAQDLLNPVWLSANSELGQLMESDWQSLLNTLPEFNSSADINHDKVKYGIQSTQSLRVMPLTVLFYEGPIARAYLETMKSLGLKPQKIIELVSAKDVVTHKTVGKWLPNAIRNPYAATIQRNKIHYWPKKLLKTHPRFVNSVLDEVHGKLEFSRTCLDNVLSLLPLATYSDEVESLLINGLDDNVLWRYLSAETEGAILYTGGGLIPAKLLALHHLKFVHIHPGFLPSIRGADCALWSSLLTGHTSATCFYMSPGIDTGDIIHASWLPKLRFNIDNVDAQTMGRQSIYRSVYSFLDPWIRSYVLREVIEKNVQFDSLSSESQQKMDGVTFHYMHQRLQIVTFKKLLGIHTELVS